MLIGKHVRLAEYEPSFAPFITEWMNDPSYRGPFYNAWTSTQPQWEEALAKAGDEGQLSFVIKSMDDDRPVGTIGYFTPSTQPSLFRALEIWYQVHRRSAAGELPHRPLRFWWITSSARVPSSGCRPP